MIINKENTIAFLVLFCIFIPLIALGNGSPVESPEDIERVLNNIVKWFYRFFIIITVIFFLFAGLTYLTANGDPNKIDKAHKMVKYGVVGALVALLSGSVVAILESVLSE